MVSYAEFTDASRVSNRELALWHPLEGQSPDWAVGYHGGPAVRGGWEAWHQGSPVGLISAVDVRRFLGIRLVVRPDMRGRGIGSELARRFLPSMTDRLLRVSWVGADAASVQLLRSWSFTVDADDAHPTFLHRVGPSDVEPAGFVTAHGVPAELRKQVEELSRHYCEDTSQDHSPIFEEQMARSFLTMGVFAGEVRSAALASPCAAPGWCRSERLMVAREHRGRGLGTATKLAQRAAAGRLGYARLLTRTPGDHPAGGANLRAGGTRLEGLHWLRQPG